MGGVRRTRAVATVLMPFAGIVVVVRVPSMVWEGAELVYSNVEVLLWISMELEVQAALRRSG